ncbi:Oxoglutarate dehydrogenase inhibitor [Polystyrenella longa]|uniref:Oxoglutarate dehydrogenase inhibitor n=1 Tax=Polystyrenella longa TaxID=2528007 RepID=A0A518CRM8_9PLAN|nr:FHA domain-containing protein [Polystyrenella longa]QDU81882.1 Oxoglutarate dehydrogenase inhibitor [Polystyrenella longa]
MPELLIKSGKHQGKRLVLPQAEVILGRDPSCQIRISSDDVSRQHCQLTVTEEGMLAQDLNSQNGTFINDVLLEGETLLSPGDEIRIGPMIFQIPKSKKSVRRINVKTQPQNKAGSKGASDADILDWLNTQDDIGGEIAAPNQSLSDTTIIPVKAISNKNSVSSGSHQKLSIADEAAEVIRNHWKAVRKSEQDPPTEG